MKAPLVRIAYVAAILLVSGYALASLAGAGGVSSLMEKRRQVEAMEKSNADLARDVERRRERIRRLSEDPMEQERVIKDTLKLVSPNEKIFIVPDPENQPDQTKP